jgi:hypothetical protein
MRQRSCGAEPVARGAVGKIEEIRVFAIEAGGDVAGLLGAFYFFVESQDDFLFDGLAALGVDGVGDVGVEFQAAVAVVVAVLVFLEAVFIQRGAAVVAEAGAEVVFFAAAGAVVGQLSAWHGEEEAVISVDEFDVTNDEGVIEGQGAEGLEAVVLVVGLAKFNPDVSQAHKDPISILRVVLSKKGVSTKDVRPSRT